jgi:hypothetical protein
MDPTTAASYQPQINRTRSSTSRLGDDGLTTGVRPRRQKSLVRPERERIDPNHRQFHYRQRATEHLGVEQVAASTTGNIPLHYQEVPERRAQRLPSFRRQVPPVRRGKSILGREEPSKEKSNVKSARQTQNSPSAGGSDSSETITGIDSAAPANAVILDDQSKNRLPDMWNIYVRALTCCFPGSVLRSFGKLPKLLPFTEKSMWIWAFVYMCVIFSGKQSKGGWEGQLRACFWPCPLPIF